MENIMSHRIRWLPVLAALLALTANDGWAQVRGAPARRGWLGISYSVQVTRTNGSTRELLVIQQVMDDSPARRAGLQASDTITAVNDLRATERLMSSLANSLAPGDEVRIRVRRGGAEQEIRVQAGERPAGMELLAPETHILMIDPDSLRGRVQIYMDSARKHIQMMPKLRIESFPPGMRIFRDSVFIWRSPRGGFSYSLVWPDSLRIQMDSAWVRIAPNMLKLRMDSMLKLRPIEPGFWGIWADSFRLAPRGGFAILGQRAIAGAELTELNPALGEYFGTERGVLVVRVPDGTPADRAGLEAGDVIISVNDSEVASVAELRREISRAGTRDPIRLEILRKQAHRTIELKE
jgi:S1-C subfamily serine protease